MKSEREKVGKYGERGEVAIELSNTALKLRSIEAEGRVLFESLGKLRRRQIRYSSNQHFDIEVD